MTRYIASRVGQAVLVLWAAFTISFVLLQAMPGDAVLIKFQNPDYGLSPEQLADIRAAYAADGSILQQYLRTLGKLPISTTMPPFASLTFRHHCSLDTATEDSCLRWIVISRTKLTSL